MPGKQKLVKEVKESVRLLRRVGKECIDQRREAIQNGKEATLDILTQILKGDGRGHIAVGFNSSVACFAMRSGEAYFEDLNFDPLMSSGGFLHTEDSESCFENSPFLCVGSNIGCKSPLSCPLSIAS